jgi:hypothetical protein
MRTLRNKTGWNVMCNVSRIVIDVDNREGHLYLPIFNAPDMSRTIEGFTSVDPEIERIFTYVDGQPDIEYLRINGEWIAV